MVNLLLRLGIWFLLTADLSIANILIGLVVALLLPRCFTAHEPLREWLIIAWETVVALPQAYWEACQMILSPHRHESITMDRVRPNRSPRLIFLDIFLITFTPKTIVLKYHQAGQYEVHRVSDRKTP